MKYTKGSIGRIFLVKFDDGDIILKELEELAKRERVKQAVFVFIGALKEGKLVTGPKKPVIPPVPNWRSFKDGWETLGIGTIFANKSGPQIHMHTSMGKASKTMTGCLRKEGKVFLVIEAVVFELKGVKAKKECDELTGINMLKIIENVK
jgi:predicted DNA-binding protein with PD1-like motif